MNYYNDNDEKICEWLENLIDAKLIPPGKVDCRSITEVHPNELREYRQCHFFAGIAGWSEALRLAGWPDEWPVWTGSCPCQPFSVAGKGGGTSDERHLWPTFRGLIAECRPPVVFGEQVASKDGLIWLAGVRAGLEAYGYAVGAADLPAACVGEADSPMVDEAKQWLYDRLEEFENSGYPEIAEAIYAAILDCDGIVVGSPHIRQRLWWVAISECRNRDRGMLCRPGESIETNQGGTSGKSERSSDIGAMANPETAERRGAREKADGRRRIEEAGRSGIDGGLADSTRGENRRITGEKEKSRRSCGSHHRTRGKISGLGDTDSEGSQGYRGTEKCASQCSLGTTGFWNNYDLIPCKDGKARRVESGTFPLAHGVPGRVVKLRAYGNAIVPQLGAEWIETVMEYITEK